MSANPLSDLKNDLDLDVKDVLVLLLIAAATYAAYCYFTWDARWWWNRRKTIAEIDGKDWIKNLIHGDVKPGWEAVREEFVHNFRVRGELGAAVCVYFRGEKVVDLWGGYKHIVDERSNQPPEPWEGDTMVNIFSTTKGISAIALALQHSRGEIDYDEKMCKYWPEFAQNGKENVTVRDVVGHAVGIAGPSPPITLEILKDKDATNDFLAKTEMEWPNPWERKGYMAILVGNYISVLLQKTTKSGKTAGQFIRDEMCRPLEVENEFYLGLPKSVPKSRIATLDAMGGLETLTVDTLPPGFWPKMIFQPKSYTARAFRNPNLSSAPSLLDYNDRSVLEVEMPGCNGVATARALAKIYSAAERAINTDGRSNPLGLLKASLDELQKPAKPSHLNGWYDEVLLMEVCISLGMMKPGPDDAEPGRFSCFGCDQRAFGTCGAGGSFAFCDPAAEIAFAYAPNRSGSFVIDDPREFALRTKVFECAQNFRRKDGTKPLPLDRLSVPQYVTGRELKRFPFLAPIKKV